MNVLMIAPGYPGEMPYFCRGLTEHGAKVYGLSDVAEAELPPLTREHLAGYLRAPNLADEDAVVRAVVAGVGGHQIGRVVCLWEPGVVLAAKLREALKVPGMRVAQAQTFRNKDLMKQKVIAAGIRTARHASATSVAQVREAAREIGFPVIVKPIAGAGSMDTVRAGTAEPIADRFAFALVHFGQRLVKCARILAPVHKALLGFFDRCMARQAQSQVLVLRL